MRSLKTTIIALLILSQVACGTILYPERQGQVSDRMDPTVLLLNGLGLFFFVVPGLVAFVVDFSTGAIYLPAGSSASSDQSTRIRKIQITETINSKSINKIINEQINIDRVLDHESLTIRRIDPDQLTSVLNKKSPERISKENTLAALN